MLKNNEQASIYLDSLKSINFSKYHSHSSSNNNNNPSHFINHNHGNENYEKNKKNPKISYEIYKNNKENEYEYKGVVYFGSMCCGHNKLTFKYNATHGGASISFLSEMMYKLIEMYRNQNDGESGDGDGDGEMKLKREYVKYLAPMRLETVQKYECKLIEKEGEICCEGRIYDFDDDKKPFITCSSIFKVVEKESDYVVEGKSHKESVDKNELPKEVEDCIKEIEKLGLKELPFKVVPENVTKLDSGDFLPNYYILSEDHLTLSSKEYSKYSRVYFRHFSSGNKSFTFVLFGQRTEGNDNNIVHTGAIDTCIDCFSAISGWINILKEYGRMIMLTTDMTIDYLKPLQRFQFVKFNFKYEIHNKTVNEKGTKFFLKVFSELKSIDEKVVYTKSVVNFFVYKKNKKIEIIEKSHEKNKL